MAKGIIAIASGLLFAMDFVTWKKSENYKGKRASLLALFLTPAMCLFSFCAAAVLGLGVKATCSNIGCNKGYTFEGSAGIYTGITCSSLAGLLFAIYAASEYTQYRRRHINGDKW
ncbi:hypothetical protein BGZ79_009173 [Entomortierella chlamydospora]|nr:hypothetical protein BGZ79_009173 [Entomortierella chlamydospora]